MVDEQEPESPLEPCQFVTMGEIGNAIFATVPRSHEHSSSEVPADPVWSPEAMIAFMYTRCQRRFGQAANESKRRLYAERLQLLRDVMAACRSNDPCTKLTAVQAIRAMEELSEDEDSPHSEQNMSYIGFCNTMDEVEQALAVGQQLVSITSSSNQPTGSSSSVHVDRVADALL